MRTLATMFAAVVLLGQTPSAHAEPRPVTWGEDIPDNSGSPSPPLQALTVEKTIYFDEIQVPTGVVVTGVDLAPDSEHWLLGVDVDGVPQLAVTRPDGSDYRCLTCGVVASAEKEELLDDGRRIWFANTSGQTSGAIADFQWSILECRPSIYECSSRKVLPVDFPIDSLTSTPQGAQNREATPDAHGEYVVWNEVRSSEGPRVTTGRLERRGSAYHVVDPRVVQPRYRLSDDPADWVAGGRFYEGGRFVLGNRYLKYQTTRTALNYDTGLLDLTTGEYTFMTRDLDYNETGDESPDGRWYSYSSARGLDRMDVFTQLERPPFLDMAAFAQVGRAGLFSNRRCMNEAWLMGFGGQEADGYGGQPLLTEDDWLARRRQWYPDSKRMLLTEQLLPNAADGVPEGRQFRLRIVRLPGDDTSPLPERSLDKVDWDEVSVPAEAYDGMASRQVDNKVVPGRVSGTATLSFRGDYSSGAWSVRYDNYSDDGLNTINGSESISVPSIIAGATYSVDLRSAGRRDGTMLGTLEIDPRGMAQGDVETTINGRTWTGLPTQDDCPGMTQPRLRAAAVRAPNGSRVVTVTARVAEDRTSRPVQGAVVDTGASSYPTDEKGRAHIPPTDATAIEAATAGGFKSWPAGDGEQVVDPSGPPSSAAEPSEVETGAAREDSGVSVLWLLGSVGLTVAAAGVAVRCRRR